MLSVAATLSQPTSILASDVSFDGFNLIVDGTTLTIDGTHSFTSLTLINGAVLTHSAALDVYATPLSLSIANALLIDKYSSIDVSGKGYLNTVVGNRHYSGGSYGGRGGQKGDVNLSNNVYGDFRSPFSFGQGGVNQLNIGTNRGGGSIKITAGSLVLYGSIKADGEGVYSGLLDGSGGGSGGSIWLDIATSFTGSGLTSVNGGHSVSNASGGGGGGRLAIYHPSFTQFDLKDSVSAAGGFGRGVAKHGGAGTIYLFDKASGVELVRIDNSKYAVDSVQSTDFDLTGAERVEVFVSNVSLVATSKLGSLLVDQGSTVVLSKLQADRLDITGNSRVTSNPAIGLVPTVLDIAAANVWIEQGSAIDVSGKGYGPGVSRAQSFDLDDPKVPSMPGAGDYSSQGGGVVKITANDLLLDGSIRSDGQAAAYRWSRGSGGALFVNVGSLQGAGQISSSGTNYGSGGRIALYYEALLGFDIRNKMDVRGSSAGTIYLKQKKSGIDELIIKGTTSYWSRPVYKVPAVSKLTIDDATIKFSKGYIHASEVNVINSDILAASGFFANSMSVLDNSTVVLSPPIVGTYSNFEVANLNVDATSAIEGIEQGSALAGQYSSIMQIADPQPVPSFYGTRLGGLASDGYSNVIFTQGFSFPYYGKTWTSVYVNENGNLTFGSPDSSKTYQRAGLPRISPMMMDFDLTLGGEVAYYQFADRLIVTWDKVRRVGGSIWSQYTLQATLFSDGRIKFGYGYAGYVFDAVPPVQVGLSPGGLLPFVSPIDYSNRWTTYPVQSLASEAIEAPASLSYNFYYLRYSYLTFDPYAGGGYSVNKYSGWAPFSGPSFANGKFEKAGVTALGPFAWGDIGENIQFGSGFVFPFYGKNHADVYANLDGTLSFGKARIDGFPRATDPAMIMALMLEEGYSTYRGNMYYKQLPDRLVVYWDGLEDNNSSMGPHTFQATIFDSGVVQLDYDSIGSAYDETYIGVSPGGWAPVEDVDFTMDTPLTTALSKTTPALAKAIRQFARGMYNIDQDYEGKTLTFNPNGKGGFDVGLFPPSNHSVSVIDSLPNGPLSSQVSELAVKFDRPMRSLTIADVKLQGPLGPVDIYSVTQVDTTRFLIEPYSVIDVDGDYTLSVGPSPLALDGAGMDQDKNRITGETPGDIFSSSFSIYLTIPSAPVVTSHIAGTVNATDSSTVTLSGDRPPGTAIYINGVLVVPAGSDPWTAAVVLPAGSSDVVIEAVDAAGNVSPATTVSFASDPVPAISNMNPADGTVTNIPFSSLSFVVDGGLNGFDFGLSQLTVARDGILVSGNWSVQGGRLLFVPASALFGEGNYTVSVQLVDSRGRYSNVFHAGFVVDTTPPPTVSVDPLPATTQAEQLLISGTKDVGASVWVYSLDSGLAGHWKADNDLQSSVGVNLDGYATTGIQYAAGKDLYAFDFAQGQSIQVQDASVFKTNTLTIAAWFNARSFTYNNDNLVCLQGKTDLVYSGSWNSYCLGLRNGYPRFYTLHGANYVYNDAYGYQYAANVNEWHHVAVSYDGTTKRFYQDGRLVGSRVLGSAWWSPPKALGFGIGTSSLLIGDKWGAGANAMVPSGIAFDGMIDDVRIYTRALKDSEIEAIATQSDKALVTPLTYDTVWSETVGLATGDNQFSYVAIDKAGNESDPATVNILFDNTAPDAVGVVTVNANGDGTEARLDWSSYNHLANGGDVAEYRIYQSLTPFTLASQATHVGTTAVKQYHATGLARGAQYYYAVVPVDLQQNYLDAVSPVLVSPVDIIAPAEVNNIQVSPADTYAQINWQASSSADASNVKLYLNGGIGTLLPAGSTSYQVTGLLPATAYPFRLTSIDANGNESAGVVDKIVTLLPNPVGVTVSPEDGRATVHWQAIASSSLVERYNIYVSNAPITDVSAMIPRVNVPRTQTTAQVAGLTNNTLYYFAVTSVNLSGGETKQVLPASTASTTPVADTFGPTVGSVLMDGSVLQGNVTVGKSVTLQVSATDPAGISRVEYQIDGQQVYLDTSATQPSSWYWDIYNTANGVHTLTISVFDSLDNVTVNNYAVNVSLAPPVAPSITSPQAVTFNRTYINVVGTTTKNTEVLLYNNNVLVGTPIVPDAIGRFTSIMSLANGVNSISASARNRAGEGAKSAAVSVTVDTSIPKPPTGLAAVSSQAGSIRLTWSGSTDVNVSGYNVYRSSTPFASIASAAQVNTTLIKGAVFDDLPATDGTYYYSMVAVKVLSTAATTLSDISTQVQAVSDRVAPTASIQYTPQGAYDAQSGRMAIGLVNVVVTVSEALKELPFVGIKPYNSPPVQVQLTKVTDIEYQGSFEIIESMNTGTAYAFFAASDRYNNNGTEILDGATIEVDTTGPVVRNIKLTPLAPIQNKQSAAASVKVQFALSEPDINGTPSLSYTLQPDMVGAIASQPTAITGIYALGGNQWVGSFKLPADSGYSAVDILSFNYSGKDDLLNVSTRIDGENAFEVYQGNLPPLKNGVPQGLRLTNVGAGQVKLSWNLVSGASEYIVYRGTSATALVALIPRRALSELIDTTPNDATYYYAVASVRKHNGLESISAKSTVLSVTTDSVPPAAPASFGARIVGAGVYATWSVPIGNNEPLTYRFYRSTVPGNVSGLAPLQEGIPALEALDRAPVSGGSYYYVTAVDASGNESASSNAVYINPLLLPVGNLKVEQKDLTSPVVSWTHGAAVGYDVFLGADVLGVKLNQQGPIGVTNYTDVGYSNNDRTYTITAIDPQGEVSAAHTIYLPHITAAIATGSTVKRGIMNKLVYEVTNHSASAIDKVRLEVNIGGHKNITPRFSIAAGEVKLVPITVGGFADLSNTTALETIIDITPFTGEQTRIIRTSTINVLDGALGLDIQSENMTRGGTGRVRFTLRNTSDVYTEIITASQSAGRSPEIRLKLLDLNNNVVSVLPYKQVVGGVRQLFNKLYVASIAPGAVFTSDWIDIPVPGTALDNMTLKLEIDKFHYHTGKPEEAIISGMSTTQQVVLVNTSYTCSVDSIAPLQTFTDPVVISGKAIERSTGLALAAAPLKLIMKVKGFEKIADIVTDASGSFAYTYTPKVGDNGTFNVSCIHPDILERPDHGNFVIQYLKVRPDGIRLRAPKNIVQTIPIRVSALASTTATNVRIVYDAYAQPSGVLPQGINVKLPASQSLQPNTTAVFNVEISADNSANASENFVLQVFADETGATPVANVSVAAQFSAANPVLISSPSFVDTGVTLGSQSIETVTLFNKGYSDMKDVVLSLSNPDGTPAPAWVNLTTVKNIGVLAVGAQSIVNIMFTPDTAVAQANYEFRLNVQSSNHNPVSIPLYATATTSKTGHVQFYLSDLFTLTPDANGNLIPGLSSATIKVQNQKVKSITSTQVTDSKGVTLFEFLPAGQYRFVASAPSHTDVSGIFWIKPDITTSQDVFLDYNFISVEFSVDQTTITDQYQINLNFVYETSVPAAVVIIEPASITLPAMQVGDVLNGEFKMTNKGLVRADNLSFTLPTSAEYKYELLQDGIPSSLAAGESIFVAYRVTKLANTILNTVATATGGAGAGSCKMKGVRIKAKFEYTCANKNKVQASVNFVIAIPPSDPKTCKAIEKLYQDIIDITGDNLTSSATLTNSAPSSGVSTPLTEGGGCSKQPESTCKIKNKGGSDANTTTN